MYIFTSCTQFYIQSHLKNKLLSFLFIAFTFSGKAQTEDKIVIGTINSLQSTILNEKRKSWVYEPPDDGASEKYEKQLYPVIYLLDGDSHFLLLVSMIQQLHPFGGNPICPDKIVAGILSQWENFYNFERPHGAHLGKTPYEVLKTKLSN